MPASWWALQEALYYEDWAERTEDMEDKTFRAAQSERYFNEAARLEKEGK